MLQPPSPCYGTAPDWLNWPAHLFSIVESAYRIVLGSVLLLLSAAAVTGGSITLAWDPDPNANNVQGYLVMYETNSTEPPSTIDAGDSTSATITDLVPGQTYYFSVAAYDTNGVVGPPSGELAYPVPAIVTLTPGTAPDESASLAWNPPPDIEALGYLVSYGTTNGQPSFTVDAGDATSLIITNLAPTQTYFFSVAPYDTNSVVGPPLGDLSYLVPGIVTLAPTAVPGGGVALTWNQAPGPDIQGYVISYGTTNGMPTNDIDAGASTTLTITNLEPGRTYYFSVATYDSQNIQSPPLGKLSYSEPGIVTPTLAAAPGAGVTLFWNQVSGPDIQGYAVFYGTTNGQPSFTLDAGAVTSITITNLDPGQTYYFSVATYDSQNTPGPPSGELAYLVPATVTLTSEAAPGGGVTLIWDQVPGFDVQGYTVSYGTTNGQPSFTLDAGATTSITITNLDPGQTYYFSVATYDSQNTPGPLSDELSYSVPAIVTLTSEAAPGGGVTLIWDQVPGFDVQGYTVSYGTTNGQPSFTLDAGATTSITITGLNPGQTYYFSVAPYDTNAVAGPPLGELSYSVPGIVTLTSKAAPGGGVTLAWNQAPGPSVQGYTVFYGTISGMPTNVTNIGSDTSITFTNLSPGQTYYFSVVTYDSHYTPGPASAELAYLIPGIVRLTLGASAGDPVNISFPVAPACWYEIQASEDLTEWDTIWTTPVYQFNNWVAFSDFDSPYISQRFYRVVSHQDGPP